MTGTTERGWILDATVDHAHNALRLWIKQGTTTSGYIYRGFRPSLFVHIEGDSERTLEQVSRAIEEHPLVDQTEIIHRFLSVYDEDRSPVIRVRTGPAALYVVARDLHQIPDAVVYHADLDPVQQFFIEEDVFPFGRVEFDRSGDEMTISRVRSIDDRDDVEYEIPPLNIIRLEVFADSQRLFPHLSDPLHHVTIEHDNGRVLVIGEQTERETLRCLQHAIDEIDPDIIVTNGGDEYLFHYLTIRARANNIILTLSRDGTPLNVRERQPSSFWQYNHVVFRPGNQVMFNGRIHIDTSRSLYYSPRGLDGIVEGCRIAMTPPQRVARMSIGSVNAAIQYYHALKRGLLIPPVKRNPEFLKSLNVLALIDRGGLIFQPTPDVYEDVVECDFSSMYPTLMVRNNISPETICTQKPEQCRYGGRYCRDVPELPYRVCQRRKGIVAEALELVIRRRREFKRLIKQGRDTTRYQLMQNTLKGVLVSCFGYLGFKNARFGRVEAHTAVTAFARKTLLRTREIGERMGLDLIHGIVDSVWLRMRGPVDYETIQEFCRRVTEETGIEMSLKGVYRWLTIPSSRMHRRIAPLNRYYGVYRNGAIKVRGLATRRRDSCLYVRDCQMEMMRTLARARNREEFVRFIPEAHAVCRRFVRKLFVGNVDARDLVIHSRLSRSPDEYRAPTRTSIVAHQLKSAGRSIHAGQRVGYVIVDADARIPEQRVRAVELMDRDTGYDAEAYAQLCIRAFEELIPAQYLEPMQPQLADVSR